MKNQYGVKTHKIEEGDRVSISHLISTSKRFEYEDRWGTVDRVVPVPYTDYRYFYLKMDDPEIENDGAYLDIEDGAGLYVAEDEQLLSHRKPMDPQVRASLDSLQKQINDLKKRIGDDV